MLMPQRECVKDVAERDLDWGRVGSRGTWTVTDVTSSNVSDET